MARSSQLDPLDRFRFIVDIDGFTRGGFTSCTAPSYNIEKREYKEGGRHLNPLLIVEGITYKPVTLSRGVNNDTSFNKWATGFIDLVQDNEGFDKGSNNGSSGLAGALAGIEGAFVNGGTSPVPSNTGDINSFTYRKNVRIFQLDRTGSVVVGYFLYNAFPIEYNPADTFDSSSEEISIENLVLGYEGFEVRYSGIAGTLGSLAAQGIASKI